MLSPPKQINQSSLHNQKIKIKSDEYEQNRSLHSNVDLS
jgi:hypothetical protein